jgi:hypothetical protein
LAVDSFFPGGLPLLATPSLLGRYGATVNTFMTYGGSLWLIIDSHGIKSNKWKKGIDVVNHHAMIDDVRKRDTQTGVSHEDSESEDGDGVRSW